MEVSFKGINSLYIGKRTYAKTGSYLAHDNKIKRGIKNYTDVLIRCNLTDDVQGAHLSEFYKTLAKCRPCYSVNCVNSKKPSEIEILMHHFQVPDGAGVQNSNFKINGYDIMLDEPEVLPLFTFMAKLTRLIMFAQGPTQLQKDMAKYLNHAVHNEAMNYIENIMSISKMK